MSILYTILIYPLELFIKLILENAYALLHNYGLSLVAVSIVISFILLPLYQLADRLQKKDKEIRAAMQPQIDDIKKAYSGYQRHLYIKALYRQYGYHPLSTLKASLGLVIQIPFLLAAFNLISSYEALQGTSFLFINDLSRPDRLLSLGGVTVNFLPILMTLVNFGASYFYAKDLPRSEGLQMVLIALVFLVILYGAPSGLLVFWTCNNIFSLIKYFILYLKR